MRKGIGPRGLGAPKSAAKMMKTPGKMMKSPAQMQGDPKKTPKHDGSKKYQNMVEGKIRNEYGTQLRAKENAIRNRTYKEAGFKVSHDPNVTKSKEYQHTKNVLDTRASKRYMNNKGPKELRAKRDAAIAESRAAYDAMPQVQARRSYRDAQFGKTKRGKK